MCLLSFVTILKVHSSLRGRCLLHPCRSPRVSCILQVFHADIPADVNPHASSLISNLHTLEIQLQDQKEQYAVLQHQLERLELRFASTSGSAAAIASIQRERLLPNNTFYTDGHKLAVLVPYRDRDQQLEILVSRLSIHLLVSPYSMVQTYSTHMILMQAWASTTLHACHHFVIRHMTSIIASLFVDQSHITCRQDLTDTLSYRLWCA